MNSERPAREEVPNDPLAGRPFAQKDDPHSTWEAVCAVVCIIVGAALLIFVIVTI